MWNHYVDCFIAPVTNAHRDEAKHLLRAQLEAAFSGRSDTWFKRYPQDNNDQILPSSAIRPFLQRAAENYYSIQASTDSANDKRKRTDKLFDYVIQCIKTDLTQRELPVMARRASEGSVLSGEHRNSTIFFSDYQGTVSEPLHSPTP